MPLASPMATRFTMYDGKAFSLRMDSESCMCSVPMMLSYTFETAASKALLDVCSHTSSSPSNIDISDSITADICLHITAKSLEDTRPEPIILLIFFLISISL